MHGSMPRVPSPAPTNTALQERYERHARLLPLLAAEAAAEAPPGGVVEAADVEQAVWLRLLELPAPPAEPVRWLRGAVRAEARRAARAGLGVRPRQFAPAGLGADPHQPAGAGAGAEDLALAAERRAAIGDLVRALPGRCPQLVSALMSRSDLTYQEISRELGISQGSLGPLRSRCLGCLRSLLKSRVGIPVVRGNAR
jgi:DNA-directed RNA polymerase specialized sigma24 family protein